MTDTNGQIGTGVLTAEQASDLVEESELLETLDLGVGFLHRGIKAGQSFVLFASSVERSGVIRLSS